MKAFARFAFVISLAVGASALALGGAVSVGNAAPSIQAVDSNGRKVDLGALRGKFVVLEWSNFGCPYVQKHYNGGNMQALQKKYTDKGVVWLTIFSSAEGAPGYYTPDVLNKLAAQKHMASTLVPDPSGTIGKAYNARNTPTMFVIDPKGNVVYMGGIDNRPDPDPASLNGATNYVAQALDEAMAGKTVSVPVSRPYGCGIKYRN